MVLTSPHCPKTVIAIDGPAGAGKSTIAKLLAKRLNFSYLDTGAMYRALTLKALKQELNLEDEKALAQLALNTTIDLLSGVDHSLRVLLDGQDVTDAIRSLEVTNNTFYIARASGVRKIMVDWQRKIGEKNNVVAEGRDIGTVVFPNATKKFYLDADFEERSRRRINELKAQGKKVDELSLKEDLKLRDHKDMNRRVGPLKKAEDAIAIDSTHDSIEEVVAKMMNIIASHG